MLLRKTSSSAKIGRVSTRGHHSGAILLGEVPLRRVNFFVMMRVFASETKRPYSGVIKVRARNGTVAALRGYVEGTPDGDFYEWHENGNLKSKEQYRDGVKHGYFFVWSTKGIVYSRRYFQNGLEDFSRFEDEGVIQSGASLASVELKEWEGSGAQFYQKFAGV